MAPFFFIISLALKEERGATLQPLALVSATRHDEAGHDAIAGVARVHRKRDRITGTVGLGGVLLIEKGRGGQLYMLLTK